MLALSGCALIAAGVVLFVADPFDGWETAGVGLIIAGTVGLATLLPPVQAWIAREQAKRDAKRESGGACRRVREEPIVERSERRRSKRSGERRQTLRRWMLRPGWWGTCAGPYTCQPQQISARRRHPVLPAEWALCPPDEANSS